MKSVGEFLINVLFILAVFSILGQCSAYDDTDDESRSWFDRRSGMGLYIDRGTGCHYVGKMFSVTPRLDASGKPVCREWDKRK